MCFCALAGDRGALQPSTCLLSREGRILRGDDAVKKKSVMTCCAALWVTGGCLWLTFKKRESAEPQSVTLSGVSVCWVAKMSVFSLLVCDCATLCENVCVFLACSTACRCCVSANLAFDWSWRCEPLGEYYFDRFTNCRICSQFVLKISFSYFYNLKNSQHGKISLSGRQNVILMLAE